MEKLKLTIELIPKGAWGNNLRETLAKNDWDTLRNLAYERAHNMCSICGNENTELNAHEVWEFDTSNKTQTLKDIIALCPACHGVKHLRNSERIGYGEHAKAHFMKINKCDEMTFANHLLQEQILFDERNKIYRWKLITKKLDTLGGKGMIITPKEIPLIVNPYENINWQTDVTSEFETIKIKNSGFNPCPKVVSIDVNNYDGTITIVAKFSNKILWENGSCNSNSKPEKIRTIYNVAGKFKSVFNVKNVECSAIFFKLIGNGGETTSKNFKIVKEEF